MFSVTVADDAGWLAFTHARRVLRAHGADELRVAFDLAEAALRDGAWIAGYVSYEAGSPFVHEPLRPRRSVPLLALGLFDAPARWTPPPGGPFAVSPLLPLSSHSAYARALTDIARRIYEGDVYQVNYTTPFAFAIEGDPLAAFVAIAARTGARYQAYVEDDALRLLSWSPELFLRFDGACLETRPMKGTAPLDRLDRLSDEKNRAEHVMIVDLLRNDLRRVCDDAGVDALCTIERYATFATMTSTISGTIRDRCTLAEIFAATFPCASITGAPKRAAAATIAALEPMPRGVYCGSIGYLSPQRRGWWNVAIRTAQLEDGHGRFDAGGGIVSDSVIDDEWREVLLKTAFLREPFELWETVSSSATDDRIDRHLARLSATASRFGLAIDELALRMRLRELPPERLVRIRLRDDGSCSVLDEPLEIPRQVGVVLAADRVRSDDPFLRLKTSWRPVHRRAFGAASARGAFDALLQNERGEFTEGTRTNLFVELDGELVTPPLECGLLPGILRATMIERGDARERVIRAGDLERVSAIYVGNSARGLIPARLLHA